MPHQNDTISIVCCLSSYLFTGVHFGIVILIWGRGGKSRNPLVRCPHIFDKSDRALLKIAKKKTPTTENADNYHKENLQV